MANIIVFSKMKTRGPRAPRGVLMDPGLFPSQLTLISSLSAPQQGSMLLQPTQVLRVGGTPGEREGGA